jgi:hypothetical protein
VVGVALALGERERERVRVAAQACVPLDVQCVGVWGRTFTVACQDGA